MKKMKKTLAVLLVMALAITPMLIPLKANAASVGRISAKKVTVYVGGTKKLTIKGGKGKKVTWTSGNSAVASVSSGGVVTGKKAGTAKVTGKKGGKKYTCKVTVPKVTISSASKSMKAGTDAKVSLGKIGSKAKVTWSSSNPSAVEFTKKTTSSASFTGIGIGESVITASVAGQKLTCRVTVKAAAVTGKNNYEKFVNYIRVNGELTNADERVLAISDGDENWEAVLLSPENSDDFEVWFNYWVFKKDAAGDRTMDHIYWCIEAWDEEEGEGHLPTAESSASYGFNYPTENNYFEAITDPATLSPSTVLSFLDKDHDNAVAEASVQDAGNALFKEGMSGWKKLVAQAGFTFSEIGFPNYQ